MVVKISEYNSLEQIEAALDKEISEAKSNLGVYLQRLTGIRSSAENARRVRQTVRKLAGRKAGSENPDEFTIDGFNIVLDAGPVDELTALETALHSSQEHLSALQKAREELKALVDLGDTDGLKYLVLENKGVPESILLRIS